MTIATNGHPVPCSCGHKIEAHSTDPDRCNECGAEHTFAPGGEEGLFMVSGGPEEVLNALTHGPKAIGPNVRKVALEDEWSELHEAQRNAREETISAGAACLFIKSVKESDPTEQTMLRANASLIIKLYADVVRAEAEIARLSGGGSGVRDEHRGYL